MKKQLLPGLMTFVLIGMFLFLANTVSLGRVLELGDTAETHNKFLEDPGTWDDTLPVNGQTKLAKGVGYPTPNDPGDASVAFPGAGNIGNNAGFIGKAYSDQIGGKAFIQITPIPVADHEYRYMTLATSHTGEKTNATIGILSFPGFGHGAPENGGEWIPLHGMALDELNVPIIHRHACWDNTLSIGNHNNINWWKKPGLRDRGVAGNSFFTPINMDAFGNEFGDLPTEWTFFIFDLAQKAMDECHYTEDCKTGRFRIEAWSYESDQEDVGGILYFDALYLTQTREEAEEIGRRRFADTKVTFLIGGPIIVSDVFTADLMVEDVTLLAGWQLDIRFDPELLEAIQVEEGDFLKGNGGN